MAKLEQENVSSELQSRARAEGLDAVLGQRFDVLDHGFIRVVDYMGNDASIVQAARVSYGAGTKTVRDDAALIRYLLRNYHTTPFEMCEIKLHVKLPIFVARQWIRHRTASVNEYSGRYSVIDNEFYVPSPDAVAAQSDNNRQGRGAALDAADSRRVMDLIRLDAEKSYSTYEQLLGEDKQASSLSVARELARIGLGVNFYTQWYWKTDLHNFMNFLRLRADSHAQYEIRAYAERLLAVLELWVPETYKAFIDYRLNAKNISGPMLNVIRNRLAGNDVDQVSSGLSQREWDELVDLLGL